jgi:hypothetical protein
MQIPDLLKHKIWQDFQLIWQVLPHVLHAQLTNQTVYAREDWQLLRLLLEVRLLALQSLLEETLLNIPELETIRRLAHLRLDRVLARALTHRLGASGPYQLPPDPYLRPTYNRYHALRDLEGRLAEMRSDSDLKDLLSLNVSMYLVEDLNLELLELHARTLGKHQKQHWPMVLDVLIAADLRAVVPSALTEQLDLLLTETDALALAADLLQRSRSVPALKAALFLLSQSENVEISLPALQRLLNTPGQHNLRAQAIPLLSHFSGAVMWGLLLPLLKDSTPDEQQADGSFAEIRAATLDALSACLRRYPEAINEALMLLQTGIHSHAWSPASRLLGLRILAEQGIQGDLDMVLAELKNALTQDHVAEINLALKTLQVMKDRRATPMLLELLQQSTRSDTALERFRQAFHAERISVQEQIEETLKLLGQPVRFDSALQRWVQEHSA